MASNSKTSPLTALIDAVHDIRPPALADGLTICTDPGEVSSVTVVFLLTPELVAAWGQKCAGQASIPANPQPIEQGATRHW